MNKISQKYQVRKTLLVAERSIEDFGIIKAIKHLLLLLFLLHFKKSAKSDNGWNCTNMQGIKNMNYKMISER